MSKRSSKFERNPRGLYPTPVSAVHPLLHYLPNSVIFDEPCAGAGDLVTHLQAGGHSLAFASDIHPMADGITECDALDLDRCNGGMFITNPPWPEPNQRGDPTLSILIHLSSLAPTWLLLPADFCHNRYFRKVESRCRRIVSVGRVKWIPDSKYSGKDNAAWFLFDKAPVGQTVFHGRAA
jgi:hypothetical protein